MSTITVKALYRYPVKSMRGEPITSSLVDTNGLLGDRALAILDKERGVLASGKNPQRWGQLLGYAARYEAEPEPGQDLPAVLITGPDGTEYHSGDPDVDARLSEALGLPVALVDAGQLDGAKGYELVWTDIEGAAPDEWKEKTAIGEQDGETLGHLEFGQLAPSRFFDVSVLHFVTTSALAHVRALSPSSTFDVRRYRPNVVVETDEEGIVENEWVNQVVTNGTTRVGVTMPAVRCVMTTLAQDELPVDRSTLRTITKHNRLEIGGGIGAWACFGVYGDVTADGSFAVGDELQVVTAEEGEITAFEAPA